MNRIAQLLTGLMLIAALNSCDDEISSGKKATGGTSEILVVTSTPEQWQGFLGDSIQSTFGQYIDALPQPEPLFDILNASVKKFENNPLYASHSLILVLNNDTAQQKAPIDVVRNKWATPQIIITLTAPNDSALLSLITEYSGAIIELFRKNQFERTRALFELSPNRDIETQLKTTFSIDVRIPGSFNLATKTNNFMWLRQSISRKKQDTDLGLIFYTQPYNDTAQFGMRHIIRMRDSIGALYIKGPTEGSFMTSSTDIIRPIRKVSDDKELGYMVITKGLWIIKKDFMGGPFVTYTLYNKKANTILTAEGFVYNPNGEKRNFIVQLESILNGIRFSDEKKIDN